MKLVFATNNKHKIAEIQQLLKKEVQLLSLAEINCMEELPETGSTLKENALQKARYVHTLSKHNCFADDTGLEIDALDGRPGVYSARYAGDEKDPEKNILKILEELMGIENRSAKFKTIISLIINDKEYLFEGIVKGRITTEKRGALGFGYDPVFIPEGHSRTFAEMTLEEKNRISHRALAVQQLIFFLNKGAY